MGPDRCRLPVRVTDKQGAVVADRRSDLYSVLMRLSPSARASIAARLIDPDAPWEREVDKRLTELRDSELGAAAWARARRETFGD